MRLIRSDGESGNVFLGHALLAFALVGAVAARYRDRGTALRLAVLAGAFATVPDVDMVYAAVGLLGVDGGALAAASAFWAASTVVHRALTHSLVVAPFVAAAAACWVFARRSGGPVPSRLDADEMLALTASLAGCLSLVALGALTSGLLGAVVMGAFGVATLGIAEATVRRTDVGAGATFLVALVGLVSHPFGDLFTGEPPALLYPLDAVVVAERVTLSADPTLHLLGAFAVELAAIWAGVVVAARLLDRSTRAAVDARAVAGVGYAAAALIIPAPTLDLSYPFVFSVISVGAVGVVPRVRLPHRTLERPDAFGAVVTGLAAVTTAGFAYAIAYLSGL